MNSETQPTQVPRHDNTLAPRLAERPRKGHLGFQELSRGDDRVQIRNARLRVLSPTGE